VRFGQGLANGAITITLQVIKMIVPGITSTIGPAIATACQNGSRVDHHWVRAFAVGEVVLTNDVPSWSINEGLFTVARTAEGGSAVPPVAEAAIASAYVWLSGGSVAIGIGCTAGHGTPVTAKTKKSTGSDCRAFRSPTAKHPLMRAHEPCRIDSRARDINASGQTPSERGVFAKTSWRLPLCPIFLY
jgi:hypothetical protein